MKSPITERDKKQKPKQPSAHLVYSTDRGRLDTIRKNSISLLDPEATAIPSLMDLTQQDYEVNAPVNNFLLNGVELLSALDTNTAPMQLEGNGGEFEIEEPVTLVTCRGGEVLGVKSVKVVYKIRVQISDQRNFINNMYRYYISSYFLTHYKSSSFCRVSHFKLSLLFSCKVQLRPNWKSYNITIID